MKLDPSAKRLFGEILATGAVLALALAPSSAFATRITSSSDSALNGAFLETFDSYAPSFFVSQDFLSGSDGFSVSAITNDLHIDNSFCASFGTTGSCLDTMRTSGAGNDDFDVVFSGTGVNAFGFDLTALDINWTIETYDSNDVLLSSYTVLSQSPGLTGFDRRGYFGATETAPIQYFTVRSAGNDRALIDNFRFVPVPEPNAAVLAGLGLIGLASVGRRETRRN